MAAFLVDEDLPRSLARRLRDEGWDAQDVRDVGLRGQPDSAVFSFAQRERRALITGDGGFGNLLAFPLGSHGGVVVTAFPNEFPVPALNDAVVAALRAVEIERLDGALLVVEPGRLRLRLP
jgi:predicted nuclease of predicted toxin-antitoxin system